MLLRSLSFAAILLGVSLGHAAPITTYMTTDAFPAPSTLRLALMLGNPPATDTPLWVSDPIPVHGTATVVHNTLSSTVGTLDIPEMLLDVDDISSVAVDLGPLGTALVSIQNVVIELQNIFAYTIGGDFSIYPRSTGNVNSYYHIGQGIVDLSNTTGIVASLAPNGYHLDIATHPVTISLYFLNNRIDGTTDTGPGGFIDRPELNVGDPTFTLDTEVGKPYLTVRFIPELHFAPVPEAGSVMMLSVGVVGMAAWGLARRRSSVVK
ncbi:hypothetical protein K2Y11_05570 [bacterium]|nr:hypothetical protein [bacterium]